MRYANRGGVKSKAFTLAEVLVTLTIIGVVAALTVPLLTANHKKSEYSAKLRKTYSAIQAAVDSAESDFDLSSENWSTDPSGGYTGSAKDFFDTYLAPYLKVSYLKQESKYGSTYYYYVFDDGTQFNVSINSTTESLYIDIDLNGFDKSPNQLGRDLYEFTLASKYAMGVTNNYPASNYKNNLFGVDVFYLSDSGVPENAAKSYKDCSSNTGCILTRLWFNNFEFSKDYPLKL